MTPWIQGFHLPQVFWTGFSWNQPRQKAWTQGCPEDGCTTPNCQMDGAMQCGRDSLLRQDQTDARDDCKSSRGWYSQPDQNHQAWNPEIVCNACKQWGHSATNCSMLAMMLFLQKYVKELMTPTTCDRIEAAWLQCWKETLGNPPRFPRKSWKHTLTRWIFRLTRWTTRWIGSAGQRMTCWKILGRMKEMKWLRICD